MRIMRLAGHRPEHPGLETDLDFCLQLLRRAAEIFNLDLEMHFGFRKLQQNANAEREEKMKLVESRIKP